jgi:hypothetical protein
MKGFLKVAYSHMNGFLKSTQSVKGLVQKLYFQELFFPPYRVISGLGDDELVLLEGLQPTFLSRPGHKI